MKPQNIALLIGTRPEAIKLMPVILALTKAGLSAKVFVTGQHRELLTPILSELNIVETENLNLMKDNQSLSYLSAGIIRGMEDILRRHKTELLIVQGDTTSVVMGALACFYEGIKIAHVEAGLRTYSRRNPFPEEMNRRVTACLADIHFAPTVQARKNLLKEGIEDERIHVVGNTVVDALFHIRDHLIGKLSPASDIEKTLALGRKIVLVTGHRRESIGADLASICEGIRLIADAFTDQIEIIYPVHLNPNIQSGVISVLSPVPNIRLVKPLTYLRFVELMVRSKLIITDSGGVQEEAAALGIPVLVTRRTCERLEAVDAGISQLVGPDPEKIFQAASELLTDESAYLERAKPTSVFGDGHAAERIVETLLKN
jgi:UDP-N-acetylglucosamine 2-epimerase (non-hydrolysing)